MKNKEHIISIRLTCGQHGFLKEKAKEESLRIGQRVAMSDVLRALVQREIDFSVDQKKVRDEDY